MLLKYQKILIYKKSGKYDQSIIGFNGWRGDWSIVSELTHQFNPAWATMISLMNHISLCIHTWIMEMYIGWLGPCHILPLLQLESLLSLVSKVTTWLESHWKWPILLNDRYHYIMIALGNPQMEVSLLVCTAHACDTSQTWVHR